MTPVILSRQQLDQLWEIDRSEIIEQRGEIIELFYTVYR